MKKCIVNDGYCVQKEDNYCNANECIMLNHLKRDTSKESQLADKWISELKAAGYSYDEILAVFRLAKIKFKHLKNNSTTQQLNNSTTNPQNPKHENHNNSLFRIRRLRKHN